MKRIKKILCIFVSLCITFILVGCSNSSDTNSSPKPKNDEYDFVANYGRDSLTIVAGSEQKVLEPIIEEYAKENKRSISINYMGSLDIMNQLQTGQIEYDAVWPASSIWINLGDEKNLLKHDQVTAITPIVFGIKESLAQQLGFLDKDVYVKDIIKSVKDGQLQFAMTSATQSNSGATAYLGFLTALAGGNLTSQDLQDPSLQEEIRQLLLGVERSSGSSNWLVELFTQGDYDAMVNYEQLIIQTNQQLQEEGRETLALVTPVDGLGISDAPLAYVDHGDSKKEELFLDFQEYILSDKSQDSIEKTGKRNAYGQISPENESIFSQWGVDPDKVLSPAPLPAKDVILESLNLYQSNFKKPSLTIYVLDFSGSMSGKGHEEMTKALEQVLIPENAQKHLLRGTESDLTYAITFGSKVTSPLMAKGNDQALSSMYDQLASYNNMGSTKLFTAAIEALKLANSVEGDYNPAIVILTDGMASDSKYFSEFENHYEKLNKDIPVFGILFGDADADELEKLAELTKGRVFDGRTDLIGAFKTVRGYN